MSQSSDVFSLLPDEAGFRVGLSDRFGLPTDTWDALRFWLSPSGAIWASAREVDLAGLEGVEAVGMLVMRRVPPRGQPSAAFLRQWCAGATRGVITLGPEEGARFLRGDTLETNEPNTTGALVMSGAEVLGRGRVAEGWLHCEISKGLRADVGDTL